MRLPLLIEQIFLQISGIPTDFAGASEIMINLPSSMRKFPDDDFRLKLPFMFNNTTLRKLIYEQTELHYLYSSLKEGTLTKYCRIFTVFIADLSLTRHFHSLRSKLSQNTHLSSDIDEFSAS